MAFYVPCLNAIVFSYINLFVSKRIIMRKIVIGVAAFAAIMLASPMVTEAKTEAKIPNGVTIGSVDVSGMTYDEAVSAVNSYMDTLSAANITLKGARQEDVVTVTAADLGLTWTNTDVVDSALNIGKEGNVVQRYKQLKDIANGGVSLDLEYAFDDTMIMDVFAGECDSFNVEEVDYSLDRENGSFSIVEGTTGYELNQTASIDQLQNYIIDSWDGSDFELALTVDVTEPMGSSEELSKVGDVLGTYSTSYKTSGSSRSGNIANGCKLASGITLYPGEEFSMLDNITPFTEENGYYLAGSYLQGQVVESFGGGICQVSTTLYNAVLKAELEVTERYSHSMIVSYVDPSQDAAIAENGGKNFKFVNSTDYPIYIDGYTTSDKSIVFTIYGVETRESDRVVTYESEVLETNVPETDTFVLDSSQPVGYVKVTQSAHNGIKAQLWKVVTVNGKEESREVVNSSNYSMVPRIVAVGTAGADENVLAQINAAIATGSYDQVVAMSNSMAAVIAAQSQQIDPTTGLPITTDQTATESQDQATTTDGATGETASDQTAQTTDGTTGG